VIKPSRRALLIGAAGATSAAALRRAAFAQAADTESHGLSVFGDLKYPPDFRHLEYVNPSAPKDGVLSQINPMRARKVWSGRSRL
jgi:microcin C transport system substrate-binding protein